MPVTLTIPLDRPATPVDVSPGGEIVLKGSFQSTQDGSVVDAATTTWPSGAPGGVSVDAGGLIDLAGGGFHLTSRDPVTHEVHAVATGDAAPACAAAGVAAPCLPLRVLPQARSRLITVSDWTKSLKGGIQAEVIAPPVYAPAASAAGSTAGKVAIGAVVILAVAFGVTRWQKARTSTPAARLAAFARRVRHKADRADPAVAAPLTPALDAAIRAIREGRVEAGSKEGDRIRVLLERVDTRLDHTAERIRAEGEQRAADELVHEVETALDAAEEALEASRARS